MNFKKVRRIKIILKMIEVQQIKMIAENFAFDPSKFFCLYLILSCHNKTLFSNMHWFCGFWPNQSQSCRRVCHCKIRAGVSFQVPTASINLRVLPPIFDPSLSDQFLTTDGARTNRFFSLKQLTPKVHGYTIWDDTASSSGSSELIKLKFQMLSTSTTVIRFW